MKKNWNAYSDSDEDGNASNSNQSQSSSGGKPKQQIKPKVQSKHGVQQHIPKRNQQKEPTYIQKPKFLSQQQIIQAINQGKYEQTSLKIRGCHDQKLKEMLNQHPLSSNEVRPGLIIVYFKNKEQLISFIEDKLRQKWKFYISPCQKRPQRGYQNKKKPKYTQKSKKMIEETKEQRGSVEENVSYSQQQQKSRKQSLQVADESVKLEYINAPGKKKDKPFFWVENNLNIKSDNFEAKKVADSMKMLKIHTKYSCIRIIVAQKYLHAAYKASDTIMETFPNWGETGDRISPNLQSQVIIEIELKQGQKRKPNAPLQAKKEYKQQSKASQKEIIKIQTKKQQTQQTHHIERVKKQVNEKIQQKRKQQFFKWNENYLTIKSPKTSPQIVLKNIQHQNIWKRYTKVHLICEKKFSDHAFQIADKICEKYKLEKIMQSGQDHHSPTIELILQPIQQTKGKQFNISNNVLKITGRVKFIQIKNDIKQKKVFDRYNCLKVQFTAPLKEQILDICRQLEGQLNLQMQQPNKLQDNQWEISLKQGRAENKEKKFKDRKKSENIELKKTQQANFYVPIQAKFEQYFNKLQQSNKHQIMLRIDIDQYCEGFKKNKNQIFKKWDCWVIRTHGQLTQNLLKLSWELEKKCGLLKLIRVQSSHSDEPYTVVQFKINKEKQQKPKKVDTYAVNSYLANR